MLTYFKKIFSQIRKKIYHYKDNHNYYGKFIGQYKMEKNYIQSDENN